MPADFDLIITADTPNMRAELELRDAHGTHLAYYQADFKTIAHSQQQGLFDLRNYLRNYVVKGEEDAEVAAIGVCIKDYVLGKEIFKHLYASTGQRTLRIQLPGATAEGNPLAAMLARVPWEIARPSAKEPSLGERNLLVRVVHKKQEPVNDPLELQPNESLRVLFVFAEAPGTRNPLAARSERRALRELFAKDIYPERRIEAHFLTHGVTRERLRDQIQEHGGYHVVHWSGHGHLNLLELAQVGGGRDRLSGDELLDLFVDAGGFLPRLFFLSACHSGDILRVKDWNDFMAIAEGREPNSKEATPENTRDIPLDEQPGYTGTAHALLRGGVPAVVAMRYAVGDEYARDLAVEFYRALLAHAQPKDAAAALTMARKDLRKANDQSRYYACDHATPVLYGAAQPGLRWEKGRSPALDTRNPRLHRIAELTMAQHEHFVGRTWELTGLGADFIGSDQQPVAVITGLGGMGKTALTAETLALWQTRFDWVLLYQAKPNALSLENLLRDIHLKLNGELGRYHDYIKARPADAIYRDASAEFTGEARYERLTRNLIRALKDEAILLVLDNFETNLKPQSDARVSSPTVREGSIGSASVNAGGRTAEAALADARATDTDATPRWACQDTAWEECLRQLAEQLRGTRSRVWLTCRHALTALNGDGCHAVLLGPLPAGEAALYLREHAGLSRMFFSADASERALAMRLLNASRFHPLLMDRLAKLAVGGDALRPQLLQALDTLEKTKEFARLPELFATLPGDAKELAYLNDALAASLDQLIQHASPDARRLLWMIAVANEPIELILLESVWGEQTHEPTTNHQPPTTALSALIAVGLVTQDDNQTLTCHELVRERSRAWMHNHRDGLTENAIRLAYADRLAAAFNALRNENMTVALSAGSRALVYCVQAEAWERLGNFASGVVTSTRDPRLLADLLPHLEAAANAAPEGQLRWSCYCYLADALKNAGQPDASLPFYEHAAVQARNAATSAPAGSNTAHQAWTDIGWITGNWAIALVMSGYPHVAHQRLKEGAEAKQNAGRPAVEIIGGELEALRIDINQGQAAQALPEIEARMARVAVWWRQYRSGQPVPEAPDPDILSRVYLAALDVAKDAHFAQEDWEAALPLIEAIIAAECELARSAEDIAGDRMNRAVVLINLDRFSEAQSELEDCLQVFQYNPAQSARTLGSLAALFDKQDDVAQAITQARRALALCEALPDPRDRAYLHNNLANYLDRSGTLAALTEAPRHILADFVYCLVVGLRQDVQGSLRNYANDFRLAHAAGTPLVVPRLTDLLADLAFDPLARWLRGRQVDVDELQAAVDELLEQVRQQAIE